jgi:hypothetical protein
VAFLLLGHRVWPAILLGAFVVNITTAGSVANATRHAPATAEDHVEKPAARHSTKAESPFVRVALVKVWAPEAELAGGAHGSERRKAPKMRVPAARHPVLGV